MLCVNFCIRQVPGEIVLVCVHLKCVYEYWQREGSQGESGESPGYIISPTSMQRGLASKSRS